jgi:transposase-like protein
MATRVEFRFSERRNLAAAKRFLRTALERHGRPEDVVIERQSCLVILWTDFETDPDVS